MTEQLSIEQRQKIIHNITLYGMIMDIILSGLKVFVGILVHSTALVADGIHSLSDMVTDIFMLIINKISHAEPDDDHPYGHARFETLGTVMLGMVLFAVGVFMGIEYVNQLISQEARALPSWWALLVVVLSLAGKEWQFRFTLSAAKKARSAMMEANAWHSRSDALSSLVVLIGIGATLAGYAQVEVVAAVFVAILIAHMGFKLAWDAVNQLADKGIEPELQAEIEKDIRSIAGVVDVHMLRSRLMGNQIFIDVHIQVDEQVSVSEGHQIGEWVMGKLHQTHPDLKDITLHIDYENDLEAGEPIPEELAPLRPDIEQYLQRFPKLSTYDTLQIHYYRQTAILELTFRAKPEGIDQEIKEAISQAEWLTDIKLFIEI